MADHNDWRADEDGDDFTVLRRPERRATPPPAVEPEEGPEPIVVTVDERRNVTGVLVVTDWRRWLAPRDLGDRLKDAANKAFMDQVGKDIDALDPQVRPAPTHRDAPSADGDPSGPVAQALVAESMELFARFETELAQYTARLRAATTAVGRGESGGRNVRVAVSSGLVSSVEVDSRWAAHARHTEVAAEALAAFQAAQRAGTDPARVDMPPTLVRLAELAGDPEALSRQLGLSR